MEDSIVEFQASAPNPNSYVHTRVMRTILGGTWGQPSSIPSTVTSGQTVTYTFNYTVPANFDMRMLRLVGMVQKFSPDRYDRRILNSGKVLVRDYWTTPLGTNEVSKNVNIKVYPNPASSNLNIELDDKNLEIKTLKVMSADGKILIEKPFQSTLNIENIASGFYYLLLSNEKESFIQSFVKE